MIFWLHLIAHNLRSIYFYDKIIIDSDFPEDTSPRQVCSCRRPLGIMPTHVILNVVVEPSTFSNLSHIFYDDGPLLYAWGTRTYSDLTCKVSEAFQQVSCLLILRPRFTVTFELFRSVKILSRSDKTSGTTYTCKIITESGRRPRAVAS